MPHGFLPGSGKRPRKPASKQKIKNTREKATRRAARPSVSCPLPRGTCVKCVRRPVSGLASLGVSPSQAGAQWHVDTPALAYRCGGSSGMVLRRTRTCFPFNRGRESALRHLARCFSLTAVDESADYSAPSLRRPSLIAESRNCQATGAPWKRRARLDRGCILNL